MTAVEVAETASKKGFRKRTELFANFRCGAEHGPKGRLGIPSLHRRLETLEEGLLRLLEQRGQQPFPAFEVPVQGTNPHTGLLCYLSHFGSETPTGEHFAGGL